MKRATHIIVILLFYVVTTAQTPSISLGFDSVCAAQEVFLPVTGRNLMNVGAITLFIGFDSLKLSYLSLENINSQLNGMSYNFVANPPKLAVAWSNTVASNYPDTKLFDIRCNSSGEPVNISFLTGCEITDIGLNVIPVTFASGGIKSGLPVITAQPQNISIREGENAFFEVSSPNTTYYRWKESKDNGNTWNDLNDGIVYSGSHSNRLTLNQVPLNFDGYKYRCTFAWENCTNFSEIATLSVDSMLGIHQYTLSDFCLGQNQPNPFINATSIEYCSPSTGFVKIFIFDETGKQVASLVNQVKSPGNHSVIFDSGALPAGIYFYTLEFRGRIVNPGSYRKMVKINPN
jgi:hypothetical protein